MSRSLSIFLFLLCACSGAAQSISTDVPVALTVTRSVSVPLNAVQLFDKAMESYKWTFGKEPGAQLIRSDRESGEIEAIARVNFRSDQLSMREESMGVIGYKILIKTHAGECSLLITEFVHRGNHGSRRAAIDLGLLTLSSEPIDPPIRMAHSNLVKLYSNAKESANDRVLKVIQDFCSRIRVSSE
ncbi:MAG: hypothetical protein WAR83_00870 [Flavobacteriales bacterium]|nr:hypothetical protein [Flavobacteriales bacterium]